MSTNPSSSLCDQQTLLSLVNTFRGKADALSGLQGHMTPQSSRKSRDLTNDGNSQQELGFKKASPSYSLVPSIHHGCTLLVFKTIAELRRQMEQGTAKCHKAFFLFLKSRSFWNKCQLHCCKPLANSQSSEKVKCDWFCSAVVVCVEDTTQKSYWAHFAEVTNFQPCF